GVDPEVDEDAHLAAGDDEGVRVDLDERAGDRRDDGGLAVARVDDHTGPDDLPGEDRVDALCHRQDGPGAGGEDRAHIRSSMSSARVSASGPTTTWMTVPWAMTPWAPAALSAAWST